jgi:hypothetical protein
MPTFASNLTTFTTTTLGKLFEHDRKTGDTHYGIAVRDDEQHANNQVLETWTWKGAPEQR